MTLQQLRYFIATVDSGFNISRAAEAVNASQPGISKQIRLLEQQLGTTLLLRSASRILGLTESGERVLDAGRRILREAEGLTQMEHDLMAPETGRLKIVTLHTYALALLPRVLKALRQRHPRVVLEVGQESPGRIVELVRAGEVDVGLSMDVPDPCDGVTALPFLKAPRIVLAPKGHPLSRVTRPTLDEIVKYPLVAQTGLSAGGWAISRVLKARGFAVQPSVLAADASLIKHYVEQELGVAIVSSLLYNARRDTGLSAIDVSHIFEPSTLTLLLDPYRYQRTYVYEFIEALAPQWTRERVMAAVRGSLDGR